MFWKVGTCFALRLLCGLHLQELSLEWAEEELVKQTLHKMKQAGVECMGRPLLCFFLPQQPFSQSQPKLSLFIKPKQLNNPQILKLVWVVSI